MPESGDERTIRPSESQGEAVKTDLDSALLPSAIPRHRQEAEEQAPFDIVRQDRGVTSNEDLAVLFSFSFSYQRICPLRLRMWWIRLAGRFLEPKVGSFSCLLGSVNRPVLPGNAWQLELQHYGYFDLKTNQKTPHFTALM